MALPKVGVEAVIEGMAKFEADSKKVNKSLGDMGTSTSRLGSIASGVTSKITSLAGSLLKIGAVGAGVAIAGIGAGLYTAASAGLSFNNAMEQAGAKINAFTKDADLTAQILEDVRLEAAKTPFEFEAMANAVSGLLPAAKQADIGIMDLLRDAEVLAASNPAEGLEGAAFALREAVSGDFTSVIERFNLPRSMINQLKAEGLPALDIVRTAMREMGYDMDLVSALANTAEGRWSTFKDTLTNVAGTITQPIFNALSEGLGGINDWLTLITPQLESFANMMAGQIAGAIEAVVISVNKVVGAFQRFGVRGAAVSILGQLGLDPTQIGQVMSVVDQVTGAIDKISGAFDRFGARGAAVSILGQLGVAPETIGLVRTTFDTIIEKIGIVQQVFAQFGAMGAGVSLLSILGLSSENIALITTGVQTIIDTFTALSTWWVTNWPIMQAVALTAWEVIQGIFAGIQTALTPALSQLQVKFAEVGVALSSLGISWSEVWNAIMTATGIVLTAIGVLILGAIGVITGLVSATASAISTIISVWQALMGQITTILTGITQSLVGVGQVWTGIISGDWAKVWQGLVLMVTGAVNQIKGLMGVLITLFTGPLAIILETVKGFVTGIIGFFQGMYDQLVGSSIVPDLINGIIKWFSGLPQKILAGLGDLSKKVTAPFLELGLAIKEELGGALTFVTDDLLPLFIEGFDLVTEGVKNFISSIREAASTLADMVVPDWLQTHSPPPMATAFEMIAKGAGNAGQAIQGMMNSLASTKWSEIRGQVFDLVDDMQDEGHYAAMGYGKSTGFAIKQAFVRAFNASFEGIMAGTISAEQLEAATKREAGAYAERVSGNFDAIVRKARESGLSLLMQMQQDLMDALPGMASTLTGLASNFADIVSKQIEGFHRSKEEAVKFAESVVSLNAKLGEQQVKLQFEQRELGLTQQKLADQKEAQDLLNLSLTEAIAEYGAESEEAIKLREKINDLQLQIDNTTLSIDEKTTAMSKLSGEMDKNRETIEKNERALAAHRAELRRQAFTGLSDLPSTAEDSLAAIEVLQEFLDSEESMLALTKEFGGGASTTWYWDRVAAQEELNRLLEEQREREAQITRQKEAQQKLSFLQSQIDLIKMGRELGGNIFGGITFGLGASADDLLSATNRVVEAMIGQINTTLGIASPSQIMVEVGQQIMAGLQRGIVSMTPTLNAQLSASVMGPLSPMMAGAMSAGNTSTTVNNWNVGGNSINNGVDAATFEARVLQVIRRNL